MCGRYKQTSPLPVIADLFGFEAEGVFTPPGIIGPGTRPPVFRDGQLNPLYWGFVPHWSKDGKKMINARAETVAEKPSFRDAFARRRCLIPANGFIEWDKRHNDEFDRRHPPQQPFDIHFAGAAPFAMAALWDAWTDPKTGEVKEGFAIITVPALPALAVIHDRMPAVLTTREEFDTWLSPETGAAELKRLLRPNDSRPWIALPAQGLGRPANDYFTEDGAQPSLFS